jgi:hypothetical protein
MTQQYTDRDLDTIERKLTERIYTYVTDVNSERSRMNFLPIDSDVLRTRHQDWHVYQAILQLRADLADASARAAKQKRKYVFRNKDGTQEVNTESDNQEES